MLRLPLGPHGISEFSWNPGGSSLNENQEVLPLYLEPKPLTNWRNLVQPKWISFLFKFVACGRSLFRLYSSKLDFRLVYEMVQSNLQALISFQSMENQQK